MNGKPIRLTTTSYAVLSLLGTFGEATPYELKQALEHTIENFWPVPHTTFYEEPARLAKAGYLSQRQEQGGRRRKRYALTDAGRAALREWTDSPGAPPSQYRDEGMLKVFAGADPQQVFAGRGDWHRAKLAELKGYMEALRSQPDGPDKERWRGPEATLVAGIAYHRQMIATLERYIDGSAGEAQTPAVREDSVPEGASTLLEPSTPL
ncbi:MAG TPA: PadR family transcriptional regulator [Solirubrobacteraceae bacterium]|jgi:PadR family transcriptional regulator AphA|nr:PadR family transcriptional regulator [Solirubrobacteraceae bacterium]